MLKWYFAIATGVLVLVTGIALWLTHYPSQLKRTASFESPSYLDVSRNRGIAYYSNYADACDELLSRVAIPESNSYRMRGNDSRLPHLLVEMNASYVEIATNRVWLVVDRAAGYGIVWEPDDFDPKIWRLTIFGDAPPKCLFARTNK